jgi:hypothetical protein
MICSFLFVIIEHQSFGYGISLDSFERVPISFVSHQLFKVGEGSTQVFGVLPSLLNGIKTGSDILPFESSHKDRFSRNAESSFHESAMPSLNCKFSS